jgi:hypothetical protein
MKKTANIKGANKVFKNNRKHVIDILKGEMARHGTGLKVQVRLRLTFYKYAGEDDNGLPILEQTEPLWMNSKMIVIQGSDDTKTIEKAILKTEQHIEEQIDTYTYQGSGWSVSTIIEQTTR